MKDSRLYRAFDHRFPHKTTLERHLATRYGELFAAEFDVLLYDLTSSYVEGAAAKDPMLQMGHSRDHRGDCKQVVLALIVNVDGFPLSCETFDGDRVQIFRDAAADAHNRFQRAKRKRAVRLHSAQTLFRNSRDDAVQRPATATPVSCPRPFAGS